MDYRSEMMYEAESGPKGDQMLHPWEDLYEYLRVYSRERPEVVALTCFCVGFVLGWKLKPW